MTAGGESSEVFLGGGSMVSCRGKSGGLGREQSNT